MPPPARAPEGICKFDAGSFNRPSGKKRGAPTFRIIILSYPSCGGTRPALPSSLASGPSQPRENEQERFAYANEYSFFANFARLDEIILKNVPIFFLSLFFFKIVWSISINSLIGF